MFVVISHSMSFFCSDAPAPSLYYDNFFNLQEVGPPFFALLFSYEVLDFRKAISASTKNFDRGGDACTLP